MRFVDEYRDPVAVERCAEAIARLSRRPWTIMEVCGGQTHAIVKFGIDRLLPGTITLVHGPGCPVCVTPVEKIERAMALAARPDVIFCSFGDMLRVPGRHGDLQSVRAHGGDVRIVYSPLDALRVAEENPDREIVFFAVGFETTAPANAMALRQAKARNVRNFSLLVSHVLVPPAMAALLSAPDCRLNGFLAAGHVCAVAGHEEYEALATRFRVPVVVTGFEPLDILQGIYMCVKQLEAQRATVENQYRRAVRREGNTEARRLMAEAFEVVDRRWRGMGVIPASGLAPSHAYREFDAEVRFPDHLEVGEETTECISGQILRGVARPNDCPAFGTRCTPEHPLGATMVSSEGACAAYYRYRGVNAKTA
ncbi:MAG: hydrogenase formation protein HypD [Candidatus Zixiibacteriota bacterium]